MTAHAGATQLIESTGMWAGYNAQAVVRDISIHVASGEVVALLGPNGAGKTTTLRALSGIIPMLKGHVTWLGSRGKAGLFRRCRQGMGYVTEERCIFYQLTTKQNLQVAGVSAEHACTLFPELAPRLGLRAGQLSGGEQQMLALARALCRKPRLLLADELSIGLAPIIVERLLATVRSAADEGLGVLLVEQFAAGAIQIADRVYVLRNGRIVLTGTGQEFRDDPGRIQSAYLSA